MDVADKFGVDVPDSKDEWKNAAIKAARTAYTVFFQYEYVPTFRSLLRQVATRYFLSTAIIAVTMAIPSIIATRLNSDILINIVGKVGLGAAALMFFIHAVIVISGISQYARDR